MVEMIDLRHVAALLASGRLLPEEAVAIAEELLTQGVGDDSVVALASLTRDENEVALGLLGQILERLQIEVPDAEEATFQLGLREVESIARGARDPLEGARWIEREVWSEYGFPEFSIFAVLIDELDEAVSPADRKAITDEIVARAQRMAGR